MRIAVLSGKGGTGKTFVSVNLANVAENATYIDCDVEEPNGRLFLKPTQIKEIPVYTKLPIFDENKCVGCRACVNFCHFNALVYIRNKPKIFPDVCHSCGGCNLVCNANAIQEELRQVGIVETGVYNRTAVGLEDTNRIHVVTGILNIGEASAIPVIKEAMELGCDEPEKSVKKSTIIIDCPPGSSCSAMESISESDYCILVVEPTAFGFHNFKMVYELVSLMNKPCGIVINKSDLPYLPLNQYCEIQNIPILMEIPYKEVYAQLSSKGEVVTQHDTELFHQFVGLLHRIEEVCL